MIYHAHWLADSMLLRYQSPPKWSIACKTITMLADTLFCKLTKVCLKNYKIIIKARNIQNNFEKECQTWKTYSTWFWDLYSTYYQAM
jgi:hypothetical protein